MSQKLPLPILSNYNLKGGAVTFTPLANYKDFIDRILLISDTNKETASFKDADNKGINDLFTSVMNETYITQTNLLNEYLAKVYKYFGDTDSSNLVCNRVGPLTNKYYIKIDDFNIESYDVNANTFIDTTQDFDLDNCGYFIFKGGNIIKYWTIFSYLKKLGRRLTNIQNILKKSINFAESGAINSYSDFDFTYYINTLDDAKYKKLLKHFMIRIKKLRDELNQQINVNANRIKLKNKKLHFDMGDYLNKNGRDILPPGIETYNLNIILSPNTTNSIITKPNPANDNIDVFTLNEVGKSMNITFNNTIITSTGIDFDLLRIKLGFDSDNNIKKSKFKSEIFDLTVMRPESDGREDFCNEIDDYTMIIKSQYNGNSYYIRAYNIEYTLKDILLMLFVTNQPLNSIFLWADKKYNKRVIRLALLFSEYIEDIQDPQEKKKEFCKALFIYGFISEILRNFQRLVLTDNQLIREQIILEILLRIHNNYVRSFNNQIYTNFWNELFNNTRNPAQNGIFDVLRNNIDLDIIRNLINDKKYLNFIIIIIIVYLQKIIIDKDVDWCKNNYNPTLTTIDLCDFQSQLINFLKIFSTYLLTSMVNITDLLETFEDQLGDVYEYLIKTQEELVLPLAGGAKNKDHNQVLTNLLSGKIELDKIYETTKNITAVSEQDMTFINKMIDLKNSSIENYEKDQANKYEINYIKNNKIIKTINKEPKLIKKEIYDNNLDDLVDKHFELVSDILNLNVDVKETDEKKISDKLNNYM